MKRIIILFLFFQIVTNANELIKDIDELPLKEYISMISNDLDMTIVISDEVDENFTLMLPHELDNSDYLKILVQILKKNDLTIEPFESFFMISRDKKDDEKNKELQFIELKNVDYETIKPLFKTINDVNHSYISSNKTIAFKSTKKEFIRISKLIQQLDKTPKQLKLKVTIIDTNLDKLKDYGTELKQLNSFTSNHNFFFNLLAYPFSVTSEVKESQTKQLHTFIKFMDTNKLSIIKSVPTLTLFDNKPTRFDIVQNVPYVNGTTTTKDGNTSSITNYSYKDVGLKLNILPRIYSKNVYLDFKLTFENLVDKTEKPTTSKNYLEQTLRLQRNKIYALTGINQTSTYDDLNSTPFLGDIPFLGWLFKTNKDNKITSNLTIFLELIEDKYVTVEDNNIVINLPKQNTKDEELSTHQKRVNEILGLNNE